MLTKIPKSVYEHASSCYNVTSAQKSSLDLSTVSTIVDRGNFTRQFLSVMCYRLSPAAVKGLGRVPVKATSSYIVIFTTWFVLRWPFVTIVTCGCERVKAGPMSKLLRAIIFMTWLDPLWLTARYNPRTKLLHDKTNSIVNISRVGAQLPEGQEIQELFNETHCTCVTAYIHMGRRLHTL